MNSDMWEEILNALRGTSREQEEDYIDRLGGFENYYRRRGMSQGSEHDAELKKLNDVMGTMRNVMGQNFKYVDFMREQAEQEKADRQRAEQEQAYADRIQAEGNTMMAGMAQRGSQPQYGGQGAQAFMGQHPTLFGSGGRLAGFGQQIMGQQAKLPTYEEFMRKTWKQRSKGGY